MAVIQLDGIQNVALRRKTNITFEIFYTIIDSILTNNYQLCSPIRNLLLLSENLFLYFTGNFSDNDVFSMLFYGSNLKWTVIANDSLELKWTIRTTKSDPSNWTVPRSGWAILRDNSKNIRKILKVLIISFTSVMN